MSFLNKRNAMLNNKANGGEEGEEMNNPTLKMLETLTGYPARPRNEAAVLPVLPTSAIVPAEDGSLVFKTFKLTRVGLMTDGASEDDWRELGEFLRAVQGSLQWLIGDWIVMGEFTYNQTYAELAELTGYNISTLYDYAYVAKGVEFSIRIEKLKFGHHQVVVAMSPEEQRYWLQMAADHEWSISRLRKEIKSAAVGDRPTPPHELLQARQFAKSFQKNVMRMHQMNPDERAKFYDQTEQLRDHCNKALRWLEDQSRG